MLSNEEEREREREKTKLSERETTNETIQDCPRRVTRKATIY